MTKIKKKPDHETFHFFNANPLNQSSGDCVIRAISAFLDRSWADVYREMAEFGIERGQMLNWDDCYWAYLESKGYSKQRMPVRDDRTKYTVEEFCQEIAVTGHRYVVRMAHHLTFIGPDRRIWDTWDCGYKTMGNYCEAIN